MQHTKKQTIRDWEKKLTQRTRSAWKFSGEHQWHTSRLDDINNSLSTDCGPWANRPVSCTGAIVSHRLTSAPIGECFIDQDKLQLKHSFPFAL